MLQNKALILIGGTAVTALMVWYVFLRDTTAAPLLTTNDLTVQEGTADRDVVETLLQLRTITLSGTVLTDPAFLRLIDTGTQIIPEPVGRSNPFLPLSRAAGPTSTAPTSSPARQN